MSQASKTTEFVLVADVEGFRTQNADRPPEHLVRELVQNALDEDGAMNLDITVTYHGPRKGTTVVVKDDSPEGVRDIKLLFTLWLSDKEDSPTKRGRMGRGLKELVSMADLTIIRTCSQDALVFKRKKGGKWTRTNKPRLGRPERGTEVSAFVRGWGEKAAKQIVAFLQRVRAPGRLTMRVNGVQVAPFVAAEKFNVELPTVMYEVVVNGERVARDRTRECSVECFTPPPGEKAFVYEMGIPVEECDSPVSIDVGQRVILRERRDTLTDSYRRELFAKVLSQRITTMSDESLRDNSVLTAAAADQHLSYSAKMRIARVWTEGRPFAATPQDRMNATGHHIEVTNLRGLPESIRDIVRIYGENVRDVMAKRKDEFCPTLTTLTAEQQKLVTFWEWISVGIARPCKVRLCKGTPGAAADFSRELNLLSIYVDAMERGWFKAPAGAKQLGLLCHELAHYTPKEDEHGSGFHSDSEDVGGAMAAFMLNNAEQARLLLAALKAENFGR